MKKMILLSVIALIFLSCRIEKGIPFSAMPYYNNNEGFRNFYIVDTIQISNPVIIHTKDRHKFVMSYSNFLEYNGKKDYFFARHSFLYREMLFWAGVPTSITNNYLSNGYLPYLDDNEIEVYCRKINGISKIYKYKEQPDFFLVIMVRGDYFNFSFIGLSECIKGSCQEKYLKHKSLYYKMAVPLFKK